MKSVLIFLISLFAVANSWAIRAITPEEDSKIRAQVGKALQDEIDRDAAKKKLKDPAISPDEKFRLQLVVSALEESRKADFNKAIWMTVQYYEILPPNSAPPQGTMIRASPNRNQPITWTPIFDEHTPHEMVDADGSSLPNDTLSDASGIASSDGISRIFTESFQSPAYLASTIVHEKEHFDQFTTKGRGDKKTPGELEVEAVDKELALEKMGVFVFRDDTDRDLCVRPCARATLT